MNLRWLAADFETSNSKINIEEEYTRVWAWDIYDPKTRAHTEGTDIETFIGEIFSMNSCIIYFHNLKFDGNFIISNLLDHGFIINDSKQHMTISTLITDRLIWYMFTVYFNGKKYIFRDSMKKITTSLAEAADAFDLKVKKGEIDYMVHRDEGYEPTDEEWDYIHRDTEILADVLTYYYENGMTSLTNASDAMKTYIKIIGKEQYNKYFPSVTKEEDDFIRKSYKGGFCYLNPKYKSKLLDKIYCYDVKSMYPSVMVECPLPYGYPEYYKGRYEHDEYMPLYIQRINVECELKEGHIPSIQTKNFFSLKLNYLKSTDGQMKELVLTSVDLKNLLTDYIIYDIEYIDGYKFKSSYDLFYTYIDRYFKLKENSKGAKKQLYKIFLNSLYGKFAMMMERTQSMPEMVDDRLKFTRLDPEQVDPMYTAVASFITSWARNKLIEGIRKNQSNFVYCDTDSMHLLKPAVGVRIGKNLGDFNIEHGEYPKKDGKYDYSREPETFVNKGKYLGQKCYILCEIKEGKECEIKKIAGAPTEVKKAINLDNFKINFTTNADQYPKFRQKSVRGGVILIPTTFTIKDK